MCNCNNKRQSMFAQPAEDKVAGQPQPGINVNAGAVSPVSLNGNETKRGGYFNDAPGIRVRNFFRR